MDDTLQELLKRIEHEWAPELLQLAGRIVFYDSLGWLIVGFLLTVAAVVIGLWSGKGFREEFREGNDEPVNSERAFFFMLSIAASFVFGVVGSFILLNIWNWIGVFDPTLAVAHRILDTVLARTK